MRRESGGHDLATRPQPRHRPRSPDTRQCRQGTLQAVIVGIHHVGVTTGNLDRLLAFYEAGLGFELVDRNDRWGNNAVTDRIVGLSGVVGRKALLRAGTLFLEMFEFASPRPGARPDPRGNVNDPGYTHIALQVTDFDAELKRLHAAGLRFDMRLDDEAGRVRVLFGRDPDGNLIEIFELSADSPFTLSSAGFGQRQTQASSSADRAASASD